MTNKNIPPTLAYTQWTDTRISIHLVFQIIGKIRMSLMPRKNHWWYATVYPSVKGFTTGVIPTNDGNASIEIEIDIENLRISLLSSDAEPLHFNMNKDLTIATFYNGLMNALNKKGLNPKFVRRPIDMTVTAQFDKINEYASYDKGFLRAFHQIMSWNNSIFQEFSGRFYGKTCPAHIYWHHLDLAVTRISNKKLPPMSSDTRRFEKDSYSHEQMSFGFWMGDENMPEPCYYAYAYPSPEDLNSKKLSPKEAFWIDSNGSPMALYKYSDVRKQENPRQSVLEFLESFYQSSAALMKWNIDELTVPDLKDL